MAFTFVHNDAHQDPTRVTQYPFKDNEVGYAGGAVRLVNGRFTKATTTDDIYGILINEVKSGTAPQCEVYKARPGDNFEVKYTGTAAAGFTPGANAVALNANGTTIDAATVTGGAISIQSINTAKGIALVNIKKRQMD